MVPCSNFTSPSRDRRRHFSLLILSSRPIEWTHANILFELKASRYGIRRCARRKDVLLQENGYRVLRFLCEDVGKRLTEVLDIIIRAYHIDGRQPA